MLQYTCCVESAVVDAWMAKLVETENLKQYTSSDLYRLFDTILTLRPEDRPTLLAAVAELRRPNRADRFSPITISTITESTHRASSEVKYHPRHLVF